MRRSLLALTLCLAVAGCGGSSSKTLSHSELVSQANAICADRNAKIKALPKSLANPTTAQQTATYLSDLDSILKPLVAKLKTLKPSSADKAAWEKAISLNEQEQALLEQADNAAKTNNATKFRDALTKAQPVSLQLDSLAKQLGLTECLKQATPSA